MTKHCKTTALVASHLKSRSFRMMALGATFGLLSVAAFATQPAKNNKFDAFVQTQVNSGTTKGWASVIIKFESKPSSSDMAKLKALKVDVTKNLDLIDSVAASVPKKNLKKLGALSFVKHVSGDVETVKHDEFTVGHTFADMAYSQMGLTGSNVTVAVVDSGINSSPDLMNPATGRSRVLASVNFVPNADPVQLRTFPDPCGHGTHIAGIVAGNGASSFGSNYFRTFYGMARGANLVSVRVLDETGATKVSTLVSALTWVKDNAARYNIRIINLSMGHSAGESYVNDPLCQAVEQLWKSGITVVVAAGNNGRKQMTATGDPNDNEGYGTNYGSINSPANDPYVITVGAMKVDSGERSTDKVATYSSRGPTRLDYVLKPDIMAPGNKVVSLRRPQSTIELGSPLNVLGLQEYSYLAPESNNSSYFKLSGTSMATPVVVGAAALMLNQNPDLSPDTIKLRLMLGADKWLNSQGNPDVCSFGSGYLNVVASLNSTVVATGYSKSPFVNRNEDGSLSLGNSGGGNGVPGHGAPQIASMGGVMDLRAIWGDRALWGDGTLAENRALWGDSVWGDRAIWGTDVFSLGTGPINLNGE